jgi:hypothetical protein
VSTRTSIAVGGAELEAAVVGDRGEEDHHDNQRWTWALELPFYFSYFPSSGEVERDMSVL